MGSAGSAPKSTWWTDAFNKSKITDKEKIYNLYLDTALRKYLYRNKALFFECLSIKESEERVITLEEFATAINEVINSKESENFANMIRKREQFFREKEISWFSMYDSNSIVTCEKQLFKGKTIAILSFWSAILERQTNGLEVAVKDSQKLSKGKITEELAKRSAGSVGGVSLTASMREDILRRLLRRHIIHLRKISKKDSEADNFAKAYKEIYKSHALATASPSELSLRIIFDSEYDFLKGSNQKEKDNFLEKLKTEVSKMVFDEEAGEEPEGEGAAAKENTKYFFKIYEKDFKEVYREVVGVKLESGHSDEDESTCLNSCSNSTFLWVSREEVTDIDRFFTRLSSKPAEDSASFSYEINFARDIERTYNKGISILIHVVFLCLAAYSQQNDRVVGSYFQTAVAEGISRDELTGSNKFFAMSFFDTVNTEDYWEFFEQKIVETFYGEDKTTVDGITGRFGSSTRPVGGIRLRQLRQAPEHCSGFKDLVESSTESCNPEGDPRQQTAFLPWTGTNNGPTRQQMTSREQNDRLYYRNNNPSCKPKSTQRVANSKKRTVRIAYADSDDGFGRIAAMVLRLLIEEQLHSEVQRDSIWVYLVAFPVDSFLSQPNLLDDFDILVNVPEEVRASTTAHSATWRDHELFSGATNRWYKTAGACSLCDDLDDLAFQSNWDNFKDSFPPSLQKIYGDHHFRMIGNIPNPGELRPTYAKPVIMKTEEEFADTMAAFNSSGWNTVYYTRFPHRIHAVVGGTELALGNGASYPQPQGRYILSKLWNTDRQRFADVEQLFSKFKFTNADVTYLMQQFSETDDQLAAACNWIKANEYTGAIWNSWMRFSVTYEMKRATDTYGEFCYPPWNRDSSKETNLFFEELTGARKSVTLPDGTTTEVPSRGEFSQLLRDASAGDLDSAEKARYLEPWVYRSCSEMGIKSSWSGRWLFSPGTSTSSTSQVALQYDCGGFGKFFTVDMSRKEVVNTVNMLKGQNWIDAATRGVLVEFFLYEQNTQLYNHIQYFVEIGATGGYVINQRHHSFRIFTLNNFDFPAIFIITGVSMMLCACYLVFELFTDVRSQLRSIRESSKRQATHFHGNHCPSCDCCGICGHEQCCSVFQLKDEVDESYCPNLFGIFRPLGVTYSFSSLYSMLTTFDNLIRFTIWILFCTALVFRFWYMNMEATNDALSCLGVWPSELEDLSYITFVITVIEGFFMILAIMFSLHYLGYLSPGFNLLLETLRRSAKNVISVLLVLLLWLLGFAITAWHVWGTLVFDFMVCFYVY